VSLRPGSKTIQVYRIAKELAHTPHVYRYRVEQAADDGLKGIEGTFSICSFWYIEALARAGRLEEARENLEQMLVRQPSGVVFRGDRFDGLGFLLIYSHVLT
jgi:GH15 family glucan-1,4-alpha-glucosidase